VHGKGVEPLRLSTAEPKAPVASVSTADDAASAGEHVREGNEAEHGGTSEGAETVAETRRLREVAALALGFLEGGMVDLAKDVLRKYLASHG
jgi:hypothetical protein